MLLVVPSRTAAKRGFLLSKISVRGVTETRKYSDERSWCVLAFVGSHSSVLFRVSVTPHSAIFKHDAAAIAPASLILLYGF